MKRLIMLISAFVIALCANAQVQYGNEPSAGSYYNTGDARIYYEVYGKGSPVVLLHGGIYGYISDFDFLIPELSKKFMVIAIATRGHGKSELGHQPLSYSLFAEDSYKVIRHLTKDSVILIGFSDGAEQAYYIAANHPDAVKKMVAIGGNFGATDYNAEGKKFINALNAEYIEKNEQAFFSPRKKIMPEPARFDEFVNDMAAVWRDSVYVSKKIIATIRCPALIMAGENDGCPVEQYTALYRLLQNGHLAIIPGSDHLVFLRQPELTAAVIWSFIGVNK